MLLKPTNLHEYQLRAINHQLTNPRSFLWVGMGLGKTVITETVIQHLIKHNCIRAALVIAPLRVVQSVWKQEAAKWEHLTGLRFSLVHGPEAMRIRALTKPADVYLINYENVAWLAGCLKHYFVNRGTLLPFDMLVLDESTRMKNIEAKRVLALAPLLQYFPWRTGLTGTPASNGLEDLFAQFLMIDDGQRLGRDIGQFRHNYFSRGGYGGYKFTATKAGEYWIHKKVADIVLELKSEDYIQMPDMVVNDIYVELSKRHRKQYDELEMLLFTQLDNGEELEVKKPSAKTIKCLQFSNGAAYTSTELKTWEKVHDAKLDALEEILEEAGGEPVLLAYNFKPDAARIMQRFKFAVNLTGMSGKEFNQALDDWKAGKIRLLMGHPASMGFGTDGLQKRGHIMVWFGLNWSLELYLQFNARLERQGQSHPVICHRILTRDTLDDLVKLSLSVKTQTQDTLTNAVNQYRKQRGF